MTKEERMKALEVARRIEASGEALSATNAEIRAMARALLSGEAPAETVRIPAGYLHDTAPPPPSDIRDAALEEAACLVEGMRPTPQSRRLGSGIRALKSGPEKEQTQ